MLRKILVVSAVLSILTMMSSGIASASWYFDLVETDTNVYDFVLVTDEEITFNGGLASFVYEDTETLDWSLTYGSFSTVISGLMGSAYEEADGDITLVNWGSFSGGDTITSDTTLATLTFTGTGDATLSFDWDDTNFEMEVDSVIYRIVDPETNSVYSAVPVPAAAWLLGSGLLGLVGLRRRNR
jgi:hypothetical protein